MTRDSRGSLMSRIARPSTASFTESSIDIVRLCHAGHACVNAARAPCSAPCSPRAARPQDLPFSAFVAGTFLFGWLLGLAVVFKLWHLSTRRAG